MAEREVRWTRTAQRDLDAIVNWIAGDSIDTAFAVLDGRRDLSSVLLERLVRA